MPIERNRIIVLIYIGLILCGGVLAKNPILPPTAFIPDGEPHVFPYKGEQRLFIYGSRDERVVGYCGYGHDVWSAPVDDLTQWTGHGEIFHVDQVKAIGYGRVDEQHFGAPDCVYSPVTKKYHLYTFLGASYLMDGQQGPLLGSENAVPGFEKFGPKCVMASSDSPAGPFTNPVMCDWAPANEAGTFDPSVLVDTINGELRVFAYWGMKKGDRWAELDPQDMHTMINPETRKADKKAWHKTLDESLFSHSTLFEASSIKKISDAHYVFIYSSNERKSGLTYCYGTRPMGPWHYGGVIVRNDMNWRQGNNHGSIARVGDRWYVSYHKMSVNSKNRYAMMEPIEVKIEGDRVMIPMVEMTSQGVEGDGLDPFVRYNAYIACYLSNGAYIDGARRDPQGLNPIINRGEAATTVGFKYFDFAKATNNTLLTLNLKVKQAFKVAVYAAVSHEDYAQGNKSLLGQKQINLEQCSEQRKDISIPCKLQGLQGKQAVFIEFISPHNDCCEFFELEFVNAL